MMFGVCNFGVQINCAKNAPQLLSLNPSTAKETNCTEQPIKAAALAVGSSCRAIANAAEDAGLKIKIAKMSEITIDDTIGEPSTSDVIPPLTDVKTGAMILENKSPLIPPESNAAAGIKIISKFVLPVTRFPTQTATMTAKMAPIAHRQ